jgi:hypothetical protein
MRPAIRASMILAFAAVALLAAGCGDTVIDDEKAEDAIQASLEESLDRKIAAVDCPSDQEVEKGATFDCSVRFGNGDRATASLEILNKDADVSLVDVKPNE